MLPRYLKASNEDCHTQEEALTAQAPLTGFIIPRRPLHPLNIIIEGNQFAKFSNHIGGSYIQFYDPMLPALQLEGRIEDIWRLPLDGHVRTFLLVRKFRDLDLHEVQMTPYHLKPELLTRVYDTRPSENVLLIEPRHVITHLTTWTRPRFLTINHSVIIVNWALNRGRR